MDNEKKVSLTINQKTHSRLSDYCKRYGVSQRHMIHLLLDDAIDNNRYPSIFNTINTNIGGTMVTYANVDNKLIRDLTSNETPVSTADEIIEELNDDFDFLLEKKERI